MAPPKKIIRDTQVTGTTVYRSSEETVKEDLFIQDSKNKVSLEEILQKKGLLGGDFLGHEKIWQEIYEEAYLKGLREGQQRGYETGKDEGLDTGFKRGKEQALSDLKQTVQLLNTLSQELCAQRELVFESAKPEIIKFSLLVCEKMLRRELLNPQVFKELIENLLEQAKLILKDAAVTVFLCPEDYQRLYAELSKIHYDKQDFQKLNLVIDSTLSQGNCRVETPLGLINFDLKRLFTDLEKRVLEVHLNEEFSKQVVSE